jgi:hypothetical protein
MIWAPGSIWKVFKLVRADFEKVWCMAVFEKGLMHIKNIIELEPNFILHMIWSKTTLRNQ